MFSRELQVPGLPAKVHYSAAQQPAYVPGIPQPNISSLSAVERTHVQSEQKTAQDQDQQLYQVPFFGQPLSLRLSEGVPRTDTGSCASLARSRETELSSKHKANCSLASCLWPPFAEQDAKATCVTSYRLSHT